LAIPLLIDLVVRQRYRQCLLLILPVAVSVGLVFGMYHILYGSCWTPPQPFVRGSLVQGLIGQFGSVRFGLLFIAPAAVVALLCWPQWFRASPRVAVLCTSGFLLQYLVTSAWSGWNGAVYGPRHLVPVLPLLFVSLAVLPRFPLYRLESGRFALSAICFISITINSLAVIYYWKYWLRHPLVDLCLHGNAELLPRFLTTWYGS
jgi:hypothetical protein